MSLRFLLDRSAVLFLGVGAGAAIGFAFATGNHGLNRPVIAPEAAPVQGTAPSTTPPPPTAPAGPAPIAVVVPPAPPVPVALAPATVARAISGGAVRVGVFGDSFGDGVWSALYRLLPADAGYRVLKFSQPSTGFTRYARMNIEANDEARIGDQPIDVAVLSFGANDAQGVCDGGHCGYLMTPFWQRVISARVEHYVAMLRRHGAAVYWVGLPVMRDPAFDGDARAMDAFYRGLTARMGVPFVEIRSLTTDAAGAYQAYYIAGDGSPKLLRAGDGIHMSMNGYIRVALPLAGQIRAAIDAARAAKQAIAAPPAQSTPASQPTPAAAGAG